MNFNFILYLWSKFCGLYPQASFTCNIVDKLRLNLSKSILCAINLFITKQYLQNMKHYAPRRQESLEKLFKAQMSKSRSQGHWPWCHLKGHHELSMHAKYKVSISNGSKVIANVKVNNTQDKNNMPRPFHLVA